MLLCPIYFILAIAIIGSQAFNMFPPKKESLQIEEPIYTGDYGVDISAPIHHYIDKHKSPLGKQRYEDMIKGCYTKYSQSECDATERARLEMNMRQCATQHNYTEMGFKKMKTPLSAWEPILEFYEQHKLEAKPENWPRGNTYVNHWDSPSQMINLENPSFRGGFDVKKKVWDGVKPILEEWTGHKLEPTSMYGIRVYSDNSVLATHVDRLPLVSSCIIQVAQDVDEPWPIEVYDHSGKAWNVTMQPGDMALYESHTVLHGRPFPMKGRFYANLFVHFQPVDHVEMNQLDMEKGAKKQKPIPKSADESSFKGNIGGHEQFNHDEEEVKRHYDIIIKEREKEAIKEVELSEEDIALNNVHEAWTIKDEYGNMVPLDEAKIAKMTALKDAAGGGDAETMAELLDPDSIELIHARDENDWQLIHEAVRGGDLDTVKLLISLGADLNSMVSAGGSVLWVAKYYLDADHEVVQHLTEIGAPDIEPIDEL